MNIGIDKIGFAFPNYYLDLTDLAEARQVDPNKYTLGLMQNQMAIAPITQDIVTLAAQAAEQILTDEDKAAIDMVILGTETGIDQSKAAAVFVHQLLGIQPFARAIELKEACYSAAAGLEFAHNHVAQHPESKVLVIASDIAKYGPASGGEPTQGAGAVALLVSADPRIARLNPDNVYQTRDIMDFWRPNYSPYPYVDGKFSTEQYADCLTTTFAQYQAKTGKQLSDFAAICLHIPFSKQGLKGIRALCEGQDLKLQTQLESRFRSAITYNQRIGNIYTGAVFLSLLSLLENDPTLKPGDDLLIYSYGSGAVCELFSATLVEGYEKMLQSQQTRLASLAARHRLSVADYEKTFFETIQLDENGNSTTLPLDAAPFYLEKIDAHRRIYKKN